MMKRALAAFLAFSLCVAAFAEGDPWEHIVKVPKDEVFVPKAGTPYSFEGCDPASAKSPSASSNDPQAAKMADETSIAIAIANVFLARSGLDKKFLDLFHGNGNLCSFGGGRYYFVCERASRDGSGRSLEIIVSPRDKAAMAYLLNKDGSLDKDGVDALSELSRATGNPWEHIVKVPKDEVFVPKAGTPYSFEGWNPPSIQIPSDASNGDQAFKIANDTAAAFSLAETFLAKSGLSKCFRDRSQKSAQGTSVLCFSEGGRNYFAYEGYSFAEGQNLNLTVFPTRKAVMGSLANEVKKRKDGMKELSEACHAKAAEEAKANGAILIPFKIDKSFVPEPGKDYKLEPGALYDPCVPGPASSDLSRAWRLANEFVFRTSLSKTLAHPSTNAKFSGKSLAETSFKKIGSEGERTILVDLEKETLSLMPEEKPSIQGASDKR